MSITVLKPSRTAQGFITGPKTHKTATMPYSGQTSLKTHSRGRPCKRSSSIVKCYAVCRHCNRFTKNGHERYTSYTYFNPSDMHMVLG
jgi:hypothetical protein